MRAIDIFGLAIAVVIAGLSQIVAPWSGPWWAGMTVAILIAVATGLHLFWANLPEVAQAAIGPTIWQPTGYLRAWIGVLLLCLLLGGGYIGSHWPTAFLRTSKTLSSAETKAPEITGPLVSRLDHFILRCDVPPPTGKTVEQTLSELEEYKKNMGILGDALGLSITLVTIRGGIRMEIETVTEEAKQRILPISSLGVTKLTLEVRRVGPMEIVSAYMKMPPQLAFYGWIPPNPIAPDTIAARQFIEHLLGVSDGTCHVI
jgi:hypothetical protein